MTKLCRAARAHLVALLSVLVASTAASAEGGLVDLESLQPTSAHRDATRRILSLMQREHYRRMPVTDMLSARILERYLGSLDGQRIFFRASDIDDFTVLRYQLDNSLRAGALEPAFDIFVRYRQRVSERAAYAIELLDKGFDFTRDEQYRFERKDAEWATSEAELNELWRKRVKNHVLSLRLAGRTEEEIADTLTKRYERMARRVAQMTPNDVFQTFVNSYTTSIDPHTSYFSPQSSENFRIRMSLSLEGIGAALQTEDEYTVVKRIIAGGPAAMSEQLHVEDRIVGVGQGRDGELVDVVSWRLAEVVDLIRGPKDTVVRLQILPDGAPVGSPPRTISLVRDKINLEERAAKSEVIEVEQDGRRLKIGVVDVPTFYLDAEGRARGVADYRSTTRDVRRLLEDLVDGGIDGVVVDLRGNQGGSLVEATAVTGLFIRSGPIVQIRESAGRVQVSQDPDPGVAYTGPLAVLVDRGSASASEIFAAAIQDYGRGVVLGEPTFGKGTVQNVVSLDRKGELGQLKLTIAQFFRVNGDGTQRRGVVPDVLFPTAKDSDSIGERALDTALAWEQVPPARHSPWNPRTPSYGEALVRHRERVQASDQFSLLTGALDARREEREQSTISLLESQRKAEWEERQADRERTETLVRKAFGSGGDDEDADIPDILLEEAARVLADLIT